MRKNEEREATRVDSTSRAAGPQGSTALVTMGIAIAALAANCGTVPTDVPVENNINGSAFELISRTTAPMLSPLTTIELWRARSGGACFAVFATLKGVAVSQPLQCDAVVEAK